jgi:hypothetical protein
MVPDKKCNACGIIKPATDFYIDKRYGTLRSECKCCWSIRMKNVREGVKPTSGKLNKQCSIYFGIHVAEKLLSNVFKNVTRMPNNNHGFDFICGRGLKIEVKSACLRNTCTPKGKFPTGKQWLFKIKRNDIADYFALLAFDNRMQLNPVYFWLIPRDFLKDRETFTVSPSTTSKIKQFEKSLDMITVCCNNMKNIY